MMCWFIVYSYSNICTDLAWIRSLDSIKFCRMTHYQFPRLDVNLNLYVHDV